MGISAHKTLSEVQRYTDDANRKKLAAAGMVKKLRGQTENTEVTNLMFRPGLSQRLRTKSQLQPSDRLRWHPMDSACPPRSNRHLSF